MRVRNLAALVATVCCLAGSGAVAAAPAKAKSGRPKTIAFRISPTWGLGSRPALLVAWEATAPPIRTLTVTVTPGANGRPATVVSDGSAGVTIPPGLDPLVAHDVRATLEFADGTPRASTRATVAPVVTGPRPRIQDPKLPAGAQLSLGRPNPCLPVRWRYNPAREAFDALPLVQAAIERLSEVNGITYVFDGVTTEYQWVKTLDAQLVRSREISRDYLLVQWENPLRPTAGLTADVIAFAGPGISRGVPGLNEAFATGATLTLRDVPSTYDETTFASTLLHELGHTAGLGHVSDPTSIMTERYAGITDYGPLDRATLAAIGMPGSGGCVG